MYIYVYYSPAAGEDSLLVSQDARNSLVSHEIGKVPHVLAGVPVHQKKEVQKSSPPRCFTTKPQKLPREEYQTRNSRPTPPFVYI